MELREIQKKGKIPVHHVVIAKNAGKKYKIIIMSGSNLWHFGEAYKLIEEVQMPIV